MRVIQAMSTALHCIAQILFAFLAVSSREAVSGSPQRLEIIPSNFQDRNQSNYMIRYLSSEASDTPDCQEDQPFPAPLSNVTACGTLAYLLNTSIATTQYNRSITKDIHNLIVFITPGVYGLGKGVTIEESKGIVISKHPEVTGEVIFECNDTPFTIYNLDIGESKDVALYGLTATKCGPRGAGIRVRQSERVTVRNCTFRNNNNCGFLVQRCINVTIESCWFISNSASSVYRNLTTLVIDGRGTFRLAGGLTISLRDEFKPSVIIVKNCSFLNNSAVVDNMNKQDSLLRPRSYNPRGHGGAVLVSFRNTINQVFHITDCFFSSNVAEIEGGALATLIYRGVDGISSHKNRVMVEKSTFLNNSSPKGVGGAIGSTYFDGAHSNSIMIKDCKVMENSARDGGGGFSFTTEDIIESDDKDISPNNINVTNTTFHRNKAPAGSGGAVSFVYYSRTDQINSYAEISQCDLEENSASFGGAIYSFRHNLNFQGYNIFTNNSESAWYFISSLAMCYGQIVFQKNRAINGGAVSLHLGATIGLQDGVRISFLQNTASINGGAIFVSSPPITADLTKYQHFFQTCFFWNSTAAESISFIENVAGLNGAAIFATDLNACSSILDAMINESVGQGPDVFQERPYIFMNNTVKRFSQRGIISSQFLATEPFSFETTLPLDNTIEGAPGQTLSFYVRCLDQLGNNQSCFWSSNIQQGFFSLPEGGKNLKIPLLDLNSYSIAEKEFEKHCSRNLTYTLRFSLIQALTSDVVNATEVGVNLTCCHPGYVSHVNGISDNHTNHTCTLDSESRNPTILRADEENKYVYIKSGYYAEVRNGTIVTARMPIVYQNCDQLGSLSGCLFKYDNQNSQCADGRYGFLCGHCPTGTSAEVTLSACVTCSWWHSFLQAVFILVWILFCILVMVYNIGIPNKFKGFLFYIQVIGYLFESTDNGIVWDNRIANLGYFTYWPLCIASIADALFIAAQGYFLSFFMILTIVVYIISAKFIKRLSNKTSFDGIWFLTYFIYKLTADSCFTILRCQRVHGGDPYEFVFHYNGSYKCFSREDSTYLVYGVVAMFLGIVVLIFPIFILVISFRRFLLTQNITDVINRGIRPSCRWWNTFDLYRRLLFTIIIILFHYIDSSYTQLFLFLSSLLVFVVFAFASPYTSKKAYWFEALLLLDLVLVSAIFLNTELKVQRKLRLLTAILLILPYLVAILYFICKFISYLWTKCPESFRLTGKAFYKKIIDYLPPHSNAIEEQDTKKNIQNTLSYHSYLSPTISPLGTNDLLENVFMKDRNPKKYTNYREELLTSSNLT